MTSDSVWISHDLAMCGVCHTMDWAVHRLTRTCLYILTQTVHALEVRGVMWFLTPQVTGGRFTADQLVFHLLPDSPVAIDMRASLPLDRWPKPPSWLAE